MAKRGDSPYRRPYFDDIPLNYDMPHDETEGLQRFYDGEFVLDGIYYSGPAVEWLEPMFLFKAAYRDALYWVNPREAMHWSTNNNRCARGSGCKVKLCERAHEDYDGRSSP
jgi:hypothetical protein